MHRAAATVGDQHNGAHEDVDFFARKPALVTLLEGLSEDVWQRLRLSRTLGISQGEETLTDILVLDVARFARRGGTRTVVTKCPKHLEPETGIDVYWSIGSPRRGWYSLALQAKRLDCEGRYYTAMYGREGHKQLAALEKFGALMGVWSGYLLYNYVDHDEGGVAAQGHCPDAGMRAPLMGCTVTPASNVRGVLDSPRSCPKSFAEIHKHEETIPLRCICCPRTMANLYDLEVTGANSPYLQVSSYTRSPAPGFAALMDGKPAVDVFDSLVGELRSREAEQQAIDSVDDGILPRVVMVSALQDTQGPSV